MSNLLGNEKVLKIIYIRKHTFNQARKVKKKSLKWKKKK